MIAALFAAAWAATTVQQEICVSVDEDLADRSTKADYWTQPAIRPLYGVRLRLRHNNAPFEVVDLYTAVDSPSSGCATFTVNPGDGYTATVYTEAKVRGYHMVYRDLPGTTLSGVSVASTNFEAQGGTLDLILSDTSPGVAELAVTSWMAVKAGHLGLGSWPGNAIHFSGFGPRVDASYATVETVGGVAPHIYIKPRATGKKSLWSIAHEVGHWIAGQQDEQQDAQFDFSAPLLGCDGGYDYPEMHLMFHREYQSAASNEGLANYVAAWTYNWAGESDCNFAKDSSFDMDLDGSYDIEPNNEEAHQEFSCEGVPWDADHDGVLDPDEGHISGYESWLTARDWLEDAVVADACGLGYPYPASVTLLGTGSEFDWMRYYWDLDTDEGLSIGTIMALHDAADPHDWEDFVTGDTPAERYQSAAAALWISAKHNNQKNNGQDR